MSYDPFEKPIGQPVDLANLQSLIDRVPEGYYVEYKSTFQSSERISHSIASFANTHGGWYFVGVVADKQTNLAKSLPGIDLTKFPDPIAKVRDVARDHIAPMPALFPELVMINSSQAVLVVYVPEGDDTPYVTLDGRIYRRAADRSDPLFEKDRLVIDRLVERGREAIRRFDRFAQDLRTHCRAEESQAWIEVYLSPYPPGLLSNPEILSAQYLEHLLSKSREPMQIDLSRELGDGAELTGQLPFTHAQTCMGSVVLRQAELSKVAFNSLELELFTDGRSRMFVPLQSLALWPRDWTLQSDRVAKLLEALVESDTHADLALAKLVDLKGAWNAMGCLVTFYLDWLPTLGSPTGLHSKVALTNVWRCVPFFDLDCWAEYVEQYGLPVCRRDRMMAPEDGRRPLVLRPDLSPFRVWHQLFGVVAVGLGLPPDVLGTFVAQSVGGSGPSSKD